MRRGIVASTACLLVVLGMSTTASADPLALVLSANGKTLTWNAVPGATKYRLFDTPTDEPNNYAWADVSGTSATPAGIPGKTLQYTVWTTSPLISYLSSQTVNISYPPGMLVGLVGLTGYGRAQAETTMATTHVKRDRVDVTSSLGRRITEGVGYGVNSLVLYAPELNGRPTATIKADIEKLASEMEPLGLTEIEFGNEVYYHGSQPAEYAAQYRVAHETLAGTGIKLLANAYGDWFTGSSWSHAASGGGWCRLFVNALGAAPDGWTLHPYGGMTEKNLGETEGWLIVPAMIELSRTYGYYAPWHITEVGQPVWKGHDGRAAVSESEQAADVAEYVRDAAKWGVVELDLFGMADSTELAVEGESAYGLWTHRLVARPSATSFGEAVKALG